jgi:hypothetical protein
MILENRSLEKKSQMATTQRIQNVGSQRLGNKNQTAYTSLANYLVQIDSSRTLGPAN